MNQESALDIDIGREKGGKLSGGILPGEKMSGEKLSSEKMSDCIQVVKRTRGVK